MTTTEPHTVTLSTGETVTLRQPAWPHMTAMEEAREGFAAVVSALYGTVTGMTDAEGFITLGPDTALDVVPILERHRVAVGTMVSLHASRSREWVEGLDLGDLVRLIGATKRTGLRFSLALVNDLVDFTWASLNRTPPEPSSSPGQSPPTTTGNPPTLETATA